MKLKGKKLDTPKVTILAIPRDDGDLIFKFQAVVDDTEFDTLCPLPTVPTKLVKDQQVPNPTDPGYLANIGAYSKRRANWLFLKSISATPDLEWETVNLSDPATWDNWRSELTQAQFSVFETNYMWAKFEEANSLDSNKIEEARMRFLASQKALDNA